MDEAGPYFADFMLILFSFWIVSDLVGSSFGGERTSYWDGNTMIINTKIRSQFRSYPESYPVLGRAGKIWSPPCGR